MIVIATLVRGVLLPALASVVTAQTVLGGSHHTERWLQATLAPSSEPTCSMGINDISGDVDEQGLATRRRPTTTPAPA